MGFEMISPLQNSQAQFLFETLHWQYQLFDSPALATVFTVATVASAKTANPNS